MSESWSEIENELATIANDFSVFDLLTPLNEEKQRNLFENGDKRNPEFNYPEPDFDPEEKAQRISKIQVPEGKFEQQFNQRLERQKFRNQVVRNRGNPEKIKEASKEIYGLPRECLASRARDILSQYSEKKKERPNTPEDVKAALNTAMSLYETEYGEDIFEDWSIEIAEDRNTGYASRSDQTFIVGSRDYLSGDPIRYVVHELGGHALLKENKKAQREFEEGTNVLRNFVYDSETEEGITTNLERITGTENPEILRKYALRALAVDSVLKNEDFRKTYERLENWESDPDRLWNTTLRAHRGGGFIKDHIYLQGRERIGEYIENGGGLRPFYVGRAPLKSIEFAESLIGDELISPKYSPSVLHTGIEEYWN